MNTASDGKTNELDRVLVLDEGRVAERGTHDALVAEEGLYAALFETQAEAYR